MQHGVEGGKKKENGSTGMTQGRYGGVRGLGGYNTSQQGSEPIAQITEVKRQIEETEKALADIVEDKKTPSSEGGAQGSHSIKGYSTIKLLNQLHIKSQIMNVKGILGGLGSMLGDVGREVGGQVLDQVTSPSDNETTEKEKKGLIHDPKLDEQERK